jgi:hypothetical protein
MHIYVFTMVMRIRVYSFYQIIHTTYDTKDLALLPVVRVYLVVLVVRQNTRLDSPDVQYELYGINEIVA